MPGDFINKIKQALPQNKKRLVGLIFILLAIPLTIVLALTQQNYINFASGADVSRVEIHPGSFSSTVGGDSIHLSALAYDSSNNPVTSGITYEWSMSSTNSVGTLGSTEGDLSEFIPLALGCGQLIVNVSGGQEVVTKSVGVAVSDGANVPDCNVPPSPSPTPISGGSGITIDLTEHGFTITDYQSTVYVKPGDYVKFMTINTDQFGNQFSFSGYPTDYGRGINYAQSSGGLSDVVPSDIEIQVNSDIPLGQYIGIPQIKSGINNTFTSLPELKVVVVNELPTPTSIPPTNSQSPTPTSSNIPSPTIKPLSPSPTPTIKPPTPTAIKTPTPTPLPQVLKTNIRTIADSYVRSNKPNKNYGKWRMLITYKKPSLISYIKFDLRSMGNKEIKKATLKFKVVKRFKKLGARSSATQSLRIVDSSWTERGITYANKPASGTLVTTFVGNKYGQVIEIDVTSVVRENNGGFLSFSIDSNKRDLLAIYSRESRNTKPKLIVEYTN